MSAPTTVLRPSAGPRIAWLPVALVFVIGTTIGAVGTASVFSLSAGDSDGSITQPIANTQLTRLLGNMNAAARRGDTRMFVQFRQDLVELVGAAGVAEFEAVRGIEPSTIDWSGDPTRHLKSRHESPTFQWSDNSGGI